jgi:putative integral membrane protein (TIGR02587 family)
MGDGSVLLVAEGRWREELTDLARAATGGLLIGIPLLYTMEMWWTGERTRPVHHLVLLVATFVVLVVLNRTSGFRRTQDVRLADAAMDAVVALALSLVLTAAVLILIREIDGTTPLAVALGKAVSQAAPFSIGVGVASHFLAESRGDDGNHDRDRGVHRAGGRGTGRISMRWAQHDEGRLNATLSDVGATVLGAVIVSASIAPTDEIPMLDAQMDTHWVLALLAASLVISYVVVFVAGFAGERQRRAQQGWLQHPITETVVCYLVSLVCALGMLWAFQRTEGSVGLALSHAVVLGLPAAIGGAAGRLAV